MTNSSTCAGLSRRSMALGVLLLTVLGLGGTTCNRSLLTFSLVGGVQVTSHYLHYLVSSDGAGRGTTNPPRHRNGAGLWRPRPLISSAPLGAPGNSCYEVQRVPSRGSAGAVVSQRLTQRCV